MLWVRIQIEKEMFRFVVMPGLIYVGLTVPIYNPCNAIASPCKVVYDIRLALYLASLMH